MEQQPLELETIKIKNGDNDYLIINLRDFNPDVHTDYDSPLPTEKPVSRRKKEDPKEDLTPSI